VSSRKGDLLATRRPKAGQRYDNSKQLQNCSYCTERTVQKISMLCLHHHVFIVSPPCDKEKEGRQVRVGGREVYTTRESLCIEDDSWHPYLKGWVH